MQVPSNYVPEFLSLPPEIRLQIYRYLLLSRPWITPELPARQYPYPYSPTRIYPNVLRTCRMIHEEAFNVLFGENVFWFRCSASAFGGYKPASTRNIPRDNLKRIEQMEIEVNQDHFLRNRIAICSVINNVTIFDDSLRLLRLHFRCNNHTGFLHVREKWWNRGGFDPSR